MARLSINGILWNLSRKKVYDPATIFFGFQVFPEQSIWFPWCPLLLPYTRYPQRYRFDLFLCLDIEHNWAPSSEFVSSSIPSWQTLTAHAQPFRGARDLAFCLKVPLDSLLVWASSGGSGETALMRRLAWTFAARIGDKYQIRLTRSNS